MKILHTSDWHIGQSLHNIDRHADHLFMLGQIREIVASEEPDLLLVSGDIFHTSQPSAASQKLLSEALVDIRKASPSTTIVLTAGNHDSASRHETHSALWETANIHTVGYIDPENPDANIVELPGKGWLAAIPYVNERNMPADYLQRVLDRIGEKNLEELPVVMSAHTTVRGSNFKGHDDTTEYYVGGIEYHELSEMGSGYDYLALGHIHHPQTLRGSHGHARYSGTPLSISFDETFRHCVSMVSIRRHGDIPDIEEIFLDELHPLINIPTEGGLPWEECLKKLQDLDENISGYVRLNVELESALPPGAFQIAEKILENKRSSLATVNSIRKRLEGKESKHLTLSEFKQTSPLEIAIRYIKDRGEEFPEEMQSLFIEATNSEDQSQIAIPTI